MPRRQEEKIAFQEGGLLGQFQRCGNAGAFQEMAESVTWLGVEVAKETGQKTRTKKDVLSQIKILDCGFHLVVSDETFKI